MLIRELLVTVELAMEEVLFGAKVNTNVVETFSPPADWVPFAGNESEKAPDGSGTKVAVSVVVSE